MNQDFNNVVIKYTGIIMLIIMGILAIVIYNYKDTTFSSDESESEEYPSGYGEYPQGYEEPERG